MLRDSAINREEWPESKPDRERRRSLGIYYTPPEAAKVLARWAIQSSSDTVLEPSFGGCAMLAAAVSVFESLGAGDPSKQLFGFDVDPTAFDHLSRMGLTNHEGHFRKQDFLRSRPKNLRVNAVLANPPFVSYHRLSSSQRLVADRLRQRYLPELPRLASLWVHFVLHSMSYLLEGGRMAFVLPNAVGSADYARPLLDFLQLQFTDVQLIHVGERLFIQAGADERISLLLLSGYMPEGVPLPARVRNVDVPGIRELAASMSSQSATHDETSTKELAESALLDLGSAVDHLDSIASVRIGEVVGDIEFFVRPLSQWLEFGIDKKNLLPLLTRAGQVSGLATPHGPDMERLPYLLRPLHPVSKPVVAYLKKYPVEAIASNKTFGKRPRWYECSYGTDAQAFIGSMNHEYPKMIYNTGVISASNAFYKITLTARHEMQKWLPLMSLSTPTRLSAEVLGRVRGSGGIKLEPSDVRRLCIPSRLPTLSEGNLDALIRKIGALVVRKELDVASQIADSEIYLKPKLIDAKTMSELRLLRLKLTNLRLRSSR